MKLIYISIEITAREYFPKILLSFFAAKRGYTVVLGDIRKFFAKNLNYKGVFHYKDLIASPDNLPLFEKLKKRGFKITSLDEEGGIENEEYDNNKSDSFLKTRFSDKTFKLVDRVFTWGSFDHNSIATKFKDFADKIITTGNPRYDFCDSYLNYFFEDKNKELDSENKKPILIVSDIGNVMSQKPLWDQIQFCRDAYWQDDNFSNHEDEVYEIYANKTIFLKNFLKLIRKLAKNFPDEKFIFRPHPTESILAWTKLIGEYNNICITKEKSSIHWIRKCKLMIHSSCYTALEAALLKKPIISFCPERCQNFKKYFLSKFGLQTTSFVQTKKILQNYLKDNSIFRENISKNYELVKDRVYLGKKLSAKKILNEWEDISKELNHSKFKTFSFYLNIYFIKIFFSLRLILNFFLKIFGVKKIKHSKFEEFKESLVIKDLNSLNKNNLRDVSGSFSVNKFDKNLCLIKFKKI